MAVDKIKVSGDPRIEQRSAFVRGKTYGYLYSQPASGKYKGTVVLLHGFPDLSIGWRYQIPLFVSKGYQVIAPDCIGYGRTDAPADLAAYSHKECADDIKELASQLGASKIILGGHDWGAYLAYRVALWHPELVEYLFTVCVPYNAPHKKYLSVEEMVEKITPHFAYQLHFISGEIEKVVHTKEEHKQFLIALYGGRTDQKEFAFDVNSGVDLEKMRRVRPSWLLSEEVCFSPFNLELEYYAWEFARHGLRGPLNWYRTRKINYDDELALPTGSIKVPVLFIQALKDDALPPHLGKGMAKHLPQLTIKQVDTSHWALWEKPKEVNEILDKWVDEVVCGGREVKL
ncbi:alpha/beta fold hydrolase [Aspergillus lucknowensis]|uniref:Alpha/Beta hydrolase protein n=1 Tax=Aspergillus lucknowensis TaxID=176173 RepID=A0ABR4LM10_9EURO